MWGWAKKVVAQQMEVEVMHVGNVWVKVASPALQGRTLEKVVRPQEVGAVSRPPSLRTSPLAARRPLSR